MYQIKYIFWGLEAIHKINYTLYNQVSGCVHSLDSSLHCTNLLAYPSNKIKSTLPVRNPMQCWDVLLPGESSITCLTQLQITLACISLLSHFQYSWTAWRRDAVWVGSSLPLRFTACLWRLSKAHKLHLPYCFLWTMTITAVTSL